MSSEITNEPCTCDGAVANPILEAAKAAGYNTEALYWSRVERAGLSIPDGWEIIPVGQRIPAGVRYIHGATYKWVDIQYIQPDVINPMAALCIRPIQRWRCIECDCEWEGPKQHTGAEVCSLCWSGATRLQRMVRRWESDVYIDKRYGLQTLRQTIGSDADVYALNPTTQIGDVPGIQARELVSVIVEEQYGEEFEK